MVTLIKMIAFECVCFFSYICLQMRKSNQNIEKKYHCKVNITEKTAFILMKYFLGVSS